MTGENRNPYNEAYGVNSSATAPSAPAPGAAAAQVPPAQAAAPAGGSQAASFTQPFSDGASAQPAYAAPAPAAAAPAKAKSGKGWIVGIVITLSIMLVCIVSVVSCTSTVKSALRAVGCRGQSVRPGPIRERPERLLFCSVPLDKT